MMVKPTISRYNKIWKCEQCTKAYSTKGCLQRHWKYECGKEPNFHCPFCSYKSYRKFNLNSHLRLKHERDTSYGDSNTEFKDMSNNALPFSSDIRNEPSNALVPLGKNNVEMFTPNNESGVRAIKEEMVDPHETFLEQSLRTLYANEIEGHDQNQSPSKSIAEMSFNLSF